MPDLIFTPSKSIATLTAVITKVLAQWSHLSPTVQAQIDARRLRLSDELLALKEFQRSNKIVDFLQWLEANPEVTALASTELGAGKGPVMRSGFLLINTEQIQQLKLALEAAPPSRAPTQQGIEIAFAVMVEFAPEIGTEERQPLIVHLTLDKRPLDQRSDGIVVVFTDLNKAVPLELSLIAPGFSEQTGDWTRTISVSSHADSLPAVFLLQAGGGVGEKALSLQFYNGVGRIARPVKIIDAVAKGLNPLRSAESLVTRGGQQQGVDYFTKINFPGQILPRDTQPLLVQLTLQPPKASQFDQKIGLVFGDLRKPEPIEVVVTAPGFQEQTGSWQRMLTVYSQADSQPAVFLLKAGREEGERSITIDFYHQGRLIGSGSFMAAVTNTLVTPPPALKAKHNDSQLEELPPNPPPPADLELRIVLDEGTNTLTFSLQAEPFGYQRQRLGEKKLNKDPRRFLESIFARLSELAGYATENLSESDTAVNQDDIATIGQGLFEELFPDELQAAYWSLKEKMAMQPGPRQLYSLLIVSDEPWIPWEIVKPYGLTAAGQPLDDGFLSETFQLCRWLTGKRGPAAQVTLQKARLVIPTSNLAYVRQEQEYFTQTLEKAHGIQVGAPLRTRSEVLQATKAGQLNLLHLAAHGNFTPDNANESPLGLENNEVLSPADLVGARAQALRLDRPIVFLNACHSSQVDFTLTGIGGWAARMVNDIGVGAFIGALWEINDVLASAFSTHFYDNLIAGQTFGEAFHAARLVIRDRQPANPTWLAYTLYADPHGRMILRK